MAHVSVLCTYVSHATRLVFAMLNPEFQAASEKDIMDSNAVQILIDSTNLHGCVLIDHDATNSMSSGDSEWRMKYESGA